MSELEIERQSSVHRRPGGLRREICEIDNVLVGRVLPLNCSNGRNELLAPWSNVLGKGLDALAIDGERTIKKYHCRGCSFPADCPLPPHIPRRQQNAFDLDGFGCREIVKVASEKTRVSYLAMKVARAIGIQQLKWHRWIASYKLYYTTICTDTDHIQQRVLRSVMAQKMSEQVMRLSELNGSLRSGATQKYAENVGDRDTRLHLSPSSMEATIGIML
jgi:hypothetical protein